MAKNSTVVIVGGGIIGLSCAHYLSESGLSVTIIEQDLIGSGASHGNCGLMHYSGVIPLCSPGVVKHEIYRSLLGNSPLYIKPRLNFALIHWLLQFSNKCNPTHMDKASQAKAEFLSYSKDLFDSILQKHQFECDLHKKGLLLLFKDEKYFNKYHATNEYLKRFNFDANRLTLDETRKLEPLVCDDIAGSFYNQNDWHLRPEMLITEWKKHLILRHVNIKEQCKLIDFELVNGKIKQAVTTKGCLDADIFVLTMGAWSSDIQKKLALNLPVQPGKGYSITMKKPSNSPKIPCLLYERNMVVTPWKNHIRLGGTMEFSGFDTKPNKKRLDRLLHGTKEYLSTSVNESIIEEWNGFRPMVYDDMPIIDQSPNQKNLFVALGHGMLGLTLATGTGKAVSDLILKKSCEIDISPYALSRF